MTEVEGSRLESIEESPHVSVRQSDQGIFGPLTHRQPLPLNHVIQSGQHLERVEGREPEPRAPGLNGGNDFVQVISDDTETSEPRMLLHDWRSFGWFVGLIGWSD